MSADGRRSSAFLEIVVRVSLMDALLNLLESLIDVGRSVLSVISALIDVILPWLPLLSWGAFWALAVDWSKVMPILRRGGCVGVVLLMLSTVLVWGAIAPPPEGTHFLFGLTVSNYAGKFVYVTVLTCIALLCGSAQMAGTFGRLSVFPEETALDDHGHGSHGHGEGSSHETGHGHEIAHTGGHAAAH